MLSTNWKVSWASSAPQGISQKSLVLGGPALGGENHSNDSWFRHENQPNFSTKNKFRPRYFHFPDGPFAYSEEKKSILYTQFLMCSCATLPSRGGPNLYFSNPNRVESNKTFLEPNRTQIF